MIETHSDDRGDLTVIEKLPFEIKRVYYIKNVPENKVRGSHAHKETERYMICISGFFKAKIRDSSGNIVQDSFVDVQSDPIFIPKMRWVELMGFSKDSVCLIIASKEFDQDDCINDYSDFIRLGKQN